MESVLILGAGPLQIPAIEVAKLYGMYVIVCDYDPNAVGFPLANEVHIISTIDKEAVLALAQEKNPDYIITSTSDAPVATVAYVCEKLHKNCGISYEDAICATNKSEMRKRLAKHNVPIPRFYSCYSFEEFLAAIADLNEKAIVKPADSAASRGVQLLDENRTEAILSEVYRNAVNYSKSGTIMVEEYMQGPEVSVECIIMDGEVHVLAITDKLVCDEPYFVELGHSEQSILPDAVKNEIMDVATKGVHAIGIKTGCAHAELKITDSGVKVVEIAARLGGDHITSHLVPLSTGIDMVKASLALAMNKPADIVPKKSAGSAIRFLYGTDGVLTDIDVDEELYQIDGIEEISIECNIGDHVHSLKSSNDRLGYVISSGVDAIDAIKKAEKAINMIRLKIEQ